MPAPEPHPDRVVAPPQSSTGPESSGKPVVHVMQRYTWSTVDHMYQ